MREILFRGKRTDGKWLYGGIEILGDLAFILPPDTSHNLNVRADTVGQYTGLTDKNGKKIFEGDIVEYSCPGRKSYITVAWDADDCGFTPFSDYDYIYTMDVIVIGNIYDNPELLGGTT